MVNVHFFDIIDENISIDHIEFTHEFSVDNNIFAL